MKLYTVKSYTAMCTPDHMSLHHLISDGTVYVPCIDCGPMLWHQLTEKPPAFSTVIVKDDEKGTSLVTFDGQNFLYEGKPIAIKAWRFKEAEANILHTGGNV